MPSRGQPTSELGKAGKRRRKKEQKKNKKKKARESHLAAASYAHNSSSPAFSIGLEAGRYAPALPLPPPPAAASYAHNSSSPAFSIGLEAGRYAPALPLPPPPAVIPNPSCLPPPSRLNRPNAPTATPRFDQVEQVPPPSRHNRSNAPAATPRFDQVEQVPPPRRPQNYAQPLASNSSQVRQFVSCFSVFCLVVLLYLTLFFYSFFCSCATCAFQLAIGTIVHKRFTEGVFQGTIILGPEQGSNWYRIKFDDGDIDDVAVEDIGRCVVVDTSEPTRKTTAAKNLDDRNALFVLGHQSANPVEDGSMEQYAKSAFLVVDLARVGVDDNGNFDQPHLIKVPDLNDPEQYEGSVSISFIVLRLHSNLFLLSTNCPSGPKSFW